MGKKERRKRTEKRQECKRRKSPWRSLCGGNILKPIEKILIGKKQLHFERTTDYKEIVVDYEKKKVTFGGKKVNPLGAIFLLSCTASLLFGLIITLILKLIFDIINMGLLGNGKSMNNGINIFFFVIGLMFVISFYSLVKNNSFGLWLIKRSTRYGCRGDDKKIVRKLKCNVIALGFNNIVLDYKATGEFGRYLKRVEVQDAAKDFKGYKNKEGGGIPHCWNAFFIFSRRPKKGYIEISYT